MAAVFGRLLVIAKRSAYEVYVQMHGDAHLKALLQEKSQVVHNLLDRHAVHQKTMQECEALLTKWKVPFHVVQRDCLPEKIEGVDLVLTIGGDGTLLEASHHLDECIPVLGINSDPTNQEEVGASLGGYDASRSTGHLCAATASTLEEVLTDVFEKRHRPVKVRRIKLSVDGRAFPVPALNDVLAAHPNPAAVTRCSFWVEGAPSCSTTTASPTVYCRSSGLRVCTAVGSTGAMKSAGGFVMDPLATALQYQVREPIEPHVSQGGLMHGSVFDGEYIRVRWGTRQGKAYIDGSHLQLDLKLGEEVTFSNGAPQLQWFRPRAGGGSRT